MKALSRARWLSAVLVVALLGCSDDDVSKPLLQGDDLIVARVGGDPISAYDLQLAVLDNLGEEAAFVMDDRARDRMLESLIAARAMAQRAKQAMTPEELAILEKRVAAYRDQLLVKNYLKANIDATPVSSEMVEQYYQKHPEKFGAVRSIEYELLRGPNNLDGKAREQAMVVLQAAAEDSRWQARAEQARKSGLVFEFAKQKAAVTVLPASLSSLITQTPAGKVSDIFWIENRPLRVRVISESWSAPKPLADVSADIRKMLAPLQLKEAVKAASEAVLKDVDVERLAPPPSG